jgi:hypothetical protein
MTDNAQLLQENAMLRVPGHNGTSPTGDTLSGPSVEGEAPVIRPLSIGPTAQSAAPQAVPGSPQVASRAVESAAIARGLNSQEALASGILLSLREHAPASATSKRPRSASVEGVASPAKRTPTSPTSGQS